MPITIPIGQAEPDFVVSPLAELVASLHVYAEPAHHPDREAWVDEARDTLDDDLATSIRATDYLWRVSRPDIFLPQAGGASVGDELNQLDALSDEDWAASVLITSSCGTLRMRPDLKSPLIDERARTEALDRASVRGGPAVDYVERVLAHPGRARAEVRETLVAYDREFFAGQWSRVRAGLNAEARGRGDVLQVVGLSATLASMSSALSVLADGVLGDSVVVDKLQDARATGAESGISFLPTVFGDPHILVAYARGRRPVIQYPVRRASEATRVDEDASLERVQEMIRAVDHPLRLRLLRSVVRGSRTTAELAQDWSVSAPEVSRHLAVLRDAGLVTSARDGRFVRYSADAVVIQRLGSDLLAGLLR
jgi:DNA-binding transcriptional ArsR family regulator